MFRLERLYVVALVLGLFLMAVPAVSAQVTPSVSVSDQAIENGTVTVDNVVSDGPGWIVIHTEQDGAPGPVIGHAAVSDGENQNVSVAIDEAQATDTLYAMLHTDAGQIGTYEFPGDDAPVQVEGQIVMMPFAVTAAPETLPETGMAPDYSLAALLSMAGAALLLGGAFLTAKARQQARSR